MCVEATKALYEGIVIFSNNALIGNKSLEYISEKEPGSVYGGISEKYTRL